MRRTLMAAAIVSAGAMSGAAWAQSPGSGVPLGYGAPPAGSPGRGGNVGGTYDPSEGYQRYPGAAGAYAYARRGTVRRTYEDIGPSYPSY